MEHDICIEWLTSINPPLIIEQEHSGMEAIDGFSEPLIDLDFETEQP